MLLRIYCVKCLLRSQTFYLKSNSMIVTNTGSIYEGQNQLRHKHKDTTEKSYAHLISPGDYTVEIPKAS